MKLIVQNISSRVVQLLYHKVSIFSILFKKHEVANRITSNSMYAKSTTSVILMIRVIVSGVVNVIWRGISMTPL